AISVIPCRPEHDHAIAQCQLGMGNATVLARNNQMFLEAECFAEPIDGGDCVVVAQGWNDGHFCTRDLGHLSFLSDNRVNKSSISRFGQKTSLPLTVRGVSANQAPVR